MKHHLTWSPNLILVALLASGCVPEPGEIGSISEAVKKSAPSCSKIRIDSPLAQAACAAKKRIGTAVNGQALAQNPTYAGVLAAEFDYVTPENEMKWGVLQPTSSAAWSFTAGDAVVDAAVTNQQAVKGHALVWHQQLPGFVTPSLSKQQLTRLMKKHIQETVKHYKKDVVAWDVVNEAVADDGTLRDSVFFQVLGPSYVKKAFEWTAEHAPKKTDLYYNDYGIETINAKSDAVYELLADLIDDGVCIDGIGMQGHLDARNPPTTEELVENFERFADLGLDIHVSELDVRVAGVAGTQTQRLALQQQIYHRVAAACIQTSACDGVSVWGVSDAYSWIDATFGPDDPLLLADDFSRKPAYRGMVDGLRGVPPDPGGLAANLASSGSFETDAAGFYGFGTPGVVLANGVAKTGVKSLRGGERTASWQGPALSLTGIAQPGFEYAASAFVRLDGATSASVEMTLKTQCTGEDAVFSSVASVTAGKRAFSSVGGTVSIPYCTLEDVALYFQGPAAGVDILLDDVTVRQTAEPLGPELVQNGGFEAGTNGWFSFGPTTLSVSADAHDGSGALLTTDRADTWQGAATSLTSSVVLGATYRGRAFVKLAGGATTSNVKLTAKSVCDGVEAYTSVAAGAVDATAWTELSGSYQVPLCDELSELTLYFEGPASGVDVLLDDVSVAQRLSVPVLEPPSDPNVVANGTFEAGSDGWYSWAGSVGVTTDLAHTGAQSLVVTGAGVGPAATNLASVVVPGETYGLSYWVNLAGADAANVHVTRAMNCGSGTGYAWVSNDAVVTAGTWTELTGSFTVPADCSLAQLELFVEGSNVVNGTGTLSLYVDDVVIAPPTNLVPNGDFEAGTAGWYSWAGSVAPSTAEARSGAQSLLVLGSGVGPAATDLKSILEPGGSYGLSFWVQLQGADSANARVVRAMNCGSGTGYSWVSNNAALTAGTWTELTGSFTVPADCNMAQLELFVEGGDIVGSAGTVGLYVDDVAVFE